MEIIQEISVPSSPTGIQKIEASIDNFFETQNIDQAHYGNFFVAVSEAATNAQRHGNKNQEEKNIEIRYAKNEDGYCICIKDEGLGFDYTNIPDPTLPENINKLDGRGIFLMNQLAEKIEFSQNGKEVSLFFSFDKN